MGLIKTLLPAAPCGVRVIGASRSLPRIIDDTEQKWVFATRWPNRRPPARRTRSLTERLAPA